MRIWKLISQPRHTFAHAGPEFKEAEIWVCEIDVVRDHLRRHREGDADALDELNSVLAHP